MIFSIGHGAIKTADELAAILRKNKVDVLADIRSKPFSRWQPMFNKSALAQLLGERFVWMGDTLGGLGPPITERALDQLVGFAEGKTICVMCSEGDPRACHRHTVIGVRLLERGILVHHILKDGTILTSKEIGNGG